MTLMMMMMMMQGAEQCYVKKQMMRQEMENQTKTESTSRDEHKISSKIQGRNDDFFRYRLPRVVTQKKT